LKDKDLQPEESETVKKAIENTRNAAMKIGQSMQQSSTSASSESTENTESKEEENKESENKK
jgi:hypothetical protein